MSPTLLCRKTSAKAACCTSLRNRRTSACCSTVLLASVRRWRFKRHRTRVSLPRAISRAASTPGKRRPARSVVKKPAQRARGLREFSQILWRSGSMPAFILWLAASSVRLVVFRGAGGPRRMLLLAAAHRGIFVAPAGIDVLVASLDVLVASLDVLVASLDVLVASLDVLVASLNVRNVFVGLD